MAKKKDYSEWSKTELVREIKKLEKRKKYGIVWEDKPEKVAELCKEKLPILEEDEKKEIKTDDKNPVNILIEGDNYHALSVLNYTHKGKIDVIYIDPPYNTGKKTEWVYNDHYVDKDDSYRHSKWLSFMSKRLKLAKNLLKSSGLIFIAIDDNEVAQLKLLCDDVFGENNFIGIICWKSRHSISNDLIISQNHNFHLVYAKRFKEIFDRRHKFRLPRELKGFKNPDNDPNGPWKLMPVDGPGGATKGNPHYEFLGVKGYWRYSKETMQKLYKKGQILKRGKSLARKYYLKDAKDKGMAPTTWWDDVGTTTEGTKELIELFGEKVFNNPKPTSLIEKILILTTDNKRDYTILDFFAGSGTTAHAVLKLNNVDKGKRKFILCTNNEDNNGSGLKVAEDICYPRIKKVIENLEKESKGKLISNRPGGLKYFKTDFVDAEPTDKNKRKLVDKSTEMLCLKEDCFDEVKNGKEFRIFKNSQDKYLGIIYDDAGIESFKKEVKKLKKQFVVYVFSLDESAREEEFEDVADLVELRPIPAVILNVYKRIFK
jgi:adenine-specific DNA-methyltransferase